MSNFKFTKNKIRDSYTNTIDNKTNIDNLIKKQNNLYNLNSYRKASKEELKNYKYAIIEREGFYAANYSAAISEVFYYPSITEELFLESRVIIKTTNDLLASYDYYPLYYPDIDSFYLNLSEKKIYVTFHIYDYENGNPLDNVYYKIILYLKNSKS